MRASKLKLAVAMANKLYNFAKLSEVSGISRTVLSYVNQGKECKPIVFIKIANALDVNPEDIIEQKE